MPSGLSGGTLLRPFYNSADIQSLDVIEESKYSEFVHHHFSVNGKRIDEEAVNHVYHVFDGSTYYNQKAMREAFDQPVVFRVLSRNCWSTALSQ